MHEESIAIWVIGVVELLLLASLSAVVLRRVRFPYTIGLVIVGLLVAIAQDRLHVLTPIQHIRLRPDVVLYLFLPTLVFPAAVQLDLRLVRQNLSPILLLAGPGVILSTVIVGGVVGALTPLSWGAALLFGALISASDPVAVMALFKDLKAPGRLSVLVDGESLLNDAVAIVLFSSVLSVMKADAVGAMTAVHGAVDLVLVSVGGAAVGAALAVVYARGARLAEDDPLVEIALSMVLAYTAFAVADYYLHVSGIIAVLVAGSVGGLLRRNRVGTDARAYLRHYWRYAEFVANSFVFLFLGIGGNMVLKRLLDGSAMGFAYIGYAVVAVTVARLIVVYGLIGLSNRYARTEPIDWRFQAIMFWGGGLRGALPLVMALSLPLAFEHRQLILDLTAGVVLFTLLVQGTTVGRLIRACGLS